MNASGGWPDWAPPRGMLRLLAAAVWHAAEPFELPRNVAVSLEPRTYPGTDPVDDLVLVVSLHRRGGMREALRCALPMAQYRQAVDLPAPPEMIRRETRLRRTLRDEAGDVDLQAYVDRAIRDGHRDTVRRQLDAGIRGEA